jgi:hypothetical protein
MRTPTVVVLDVFRRQTEQMGLVYYDYVVQALAAKHLDHALGDADCLWTTERSEHRLDANRALV